MLRNIYCRESIRYPYNENWSCPPTPFENLIKAPVWAGEKLYYPESPEGHQTETLRPFAPTETTMNTRILMTATSIVLALAGVLTLFLPDNLLALLGLPATQPMPVLVQLLGSLFFSLAILDWTAKDSRIGGIYARPISLGNFTHFFVGALLLVKFQLSNAGHAALWVVVIVYGVFAALFGWLLFGSSGIAKGAAAAGE
jgi:hypothetical protein